MRSLVSLSIAVTLCGAPGAASADRVHDGRARVRDVLRASADWTPPRNTIVYVVGGNFDYGPLRRGYMSPARKAADQLGLAVVDSSANPNGSVADNAARIRRDLDRILSVRPGVTILVAANSKGYADWAEAMGDAPETVQRARDQIGVFALTPNWGGTRLAGFVLEHRWLERTVARLFSRKRSPWDRKSLEDITPAARQRANARNAARPRVTTRLIVATAQVSRRAKTDLMVPLAAQIPTDAPHERWHFDRATHGSFTMAGLGWSRSTRLHRAALMKLSDSINGRARRAAPRRSGSRAIRASR
ncbi:MAG TPA: hypothetical protein VMZ28_31210 [Kofleriaceae bacterium]|nr:hypothetical protein [Kofleriaceae bacterium]